MKHYFIVILLFFSCKTFLFRDKDSDLKTVKFSVTGDIMCHSTQITSAYKKDCDCYDFDPVFNRVSSLLHMGDITIGNFETTLPGDKKEYTGYPTFGAPDSLAVAAKNSGFDILTLSNNHCLDKGKKGVERTIDLMDSIGIKHLGVYKSEDDFKKRRVLLYEKKGIRFAFLAYTYGTNGIMIPKGIHVNLIDKQAISEDIKIAREMKPDFIIVYFHFGPEYARMPDKSQLETVEHTFNEGADIVLGGHPHVLQPYELKFLKDKYGQVKKRLVIYSLGNFVSGQYKRYTDGGIIFNFTVSMKNESGKIVKDIKNINYMPVWVYVANHPLGYSYNIVPVEKYLNNDFNPSLTKDARKKMMDFYKDTVTHLDGNSKLEN